MSSRKYVEVKGHSGLVKDPKSNAVLNINSSEIQAAKERKKRMLEKLKEEEALKNDVAELKSDMTEIKFLLQQILEKK